MWTSLARPIAILSLLALGFVLFALLATAFVPDLVDEFWLLADPRTLLGAFGPWVYVGLFAIIFAETGLLVGFIFPGDSLLLATGLLALSGEGTDLSLPLVMTVCAAAAILGNLTGFALGRRVGRRLYARPESRFFKPEHLVAAEQFYAKHGGKAIVLARFIPFARTFAPIVAGIGNMSRTRFVLYSIIGGILWGAGLPLLGNILGQNIPNIDRYLLPAIVAIVLISLLPAAMAALRKER